MDNPTIIIAQIPFLSPLLSGILNLFYEIMKGYLFISFLSVRPQR